MRCINKAITGPVSRAGRQYNFKIFARQLAVHLSINFEQLCGNVTLVWKNCGVLLKPELVRLS